MKEAIERYLDREESSEQIKRETLERWERYETTGDHISDKAIEAWLESWGTEHEGRRPQPGARSGCPKPPLTFRGSETSWDRAIPPPRAVRPPRSARWSRS